MSRASPLPPSGECSNGPYILFFDSGSARIRPADRKTLRDGVKWARVCGPARWEVWGHTDTSEPANLSRKRALVVRAYLESRGVPHRLIHIEALGATRQRVQTPPATREPQNRRVEVTLGPPGAR